MVKIETGNIFLSDCQAIVNTVNTDGYMGAGIAKAFKELFPLNNQKYIEACRSKELVVGKLLVSEENNMIIINFPTKRSYKHPSKMEYIEKGLDELLKVIEINKIKSIAMPLLGCGHGKLNEKEVINLIHKKMDKIETDVYIYIPLKYSFPIDKNISNSVYFSIIAMRYNDYTKNEILNKLKEEKKDTRFFEEHVNAIYETIQKNSTTLEMLYKDLILKDKKCLSISSKYEKINKEKRRLND